MAEGLQKRIMKNSNTIGHVLNNEVIIIINRSCMLLILWFLIMQFHCRLESHGNEIADLVSSYNSLCYRSMFQSSNLEEGRLAGVV